MISGLIWIVVAWSKPNIGPAPIGYKLAYADQVIDVGNVTTASIQIDPTQLSSIQVISYNDFGASAPSPAQYVGIAECPDHQSGINVPNLADSCDTINYLKNEYKKWQTLATHPNGQLYSEHWAACGATVKAQTAEINRLSGLLSSCNNSLNTANARITKILKKCGSKCKGM